MAWWLMPRAPDPEVGGSSPTRVKPCCVIEQGTFTPQKVLVIPRKRWLRPNMTEKLFTGTLRINQPTDQIVCNFAPYKTPESVGFGDVLCHNGICKNVILVLDEVRMTCTLNHYIM